MKVIDKAWTGMKRERCARSGRAARLFSVIVALLLIAGCVQSPLPTPQPVAATRALPAPTAVSTPTPEAPPEATALPGPTPTMIPAEGPAITATAAISTTEPVTSTGATVPLSPSARVGEQGIYEDPAGRYKVPVPANWNVEPAQDYTLLSSPDEGIKMYCLVVQGNDSEQALSTGWHVVDKQFNLEPKQTNKAPSQAGVDETLGVNYDTGDPQHLVQALVQRVSDQVYLLLIDADANALATRTSQAQIVASGFTIVGLASADLSGATPRAVDPAMLAELDAYVVDAMKQAGVPGAEVAIVQNGQVVHLKGYGVRDQGTNEPVTPDTLMMIGSVGKTMTTMMMGTLVDDGHMTWDTPAVQILPSFAVADPALSRQITMRNLVCACTGVPRRDIELVFNAGHLSAQDVVKSLSTFEFFTKFGEAFQYSNQMVATAGYVSAVAAGASPENMYNGYVQQMQQRIFDPIGMTHTTFSFESVAAAPDHATPYGLNLDGRYTPLPLSTEMLLEPVAPAGASWSTARDMASYLITELNRGVAPDGKRVVSAANLQVTWQPQVAMTADTSYGLGWFVSKYKGLLMMEHGGNTFGFTTDLAFLPEANLGIVVMANAQISNAFNQAVRTRLFELAFGLPAEGDAQFKYLLQASQQSFDTLAGQLRDTINQAAVTPYLGTFSNEALGTIQISLQDGKLILDAGEFASELRTRTSQGNTTYLIFNPPLAGSSFQFKQDANGQPMIVLTSPPDEYTFIKEK